MPFVVDVDVELEQKGYRSVWCPYPANFHETWQPGPAAAPMRESVPRG